MNDLKVIENELVPVYETSTGEKVVYGTELYENLGSKRQYTDWIKGRLAECDSVENEDYESFSQKSEKPKGGRPILEYIIKLDTAKEMAMMQRNEKGKQVRRYFIQVEKKYKAGKEQTKIEQDKPKRIPLSSVNMMVKNIKESLKEAEVEPIYIATEVKRLYTDAGYPVTAPLITDKETMSKLYDCTEIAKELGIYSTSGKPHNQAVSAIIKKLHIPDSEIVTTAFSRNGHDDVTIQYKPSVLEDVRLWLAENNYPTRILCVDSKGNQKTCTVVYREVA